VIFVKQSIKVLSAVIILSFLCACSQLQPFSSFSPYSEFSLEMDAQKGESEFSATLNAVDAYNISLLFHTPSQLDTFQITLTPEGYSVNAYGINDALPPEYIGENSLLDIIFSSIQTFIYSDFSDFKKDRQSGNYTAEITVNNTLVSAVFTPDGYLLSLSAPDKAFSATFTNTQTDIDKQQEK